MTRFLALAALLVGAAPAVCSDRVNVPFVVSVSTVVPTGRWIPIHNWTKEELARFNQTMRQSLRNEAIRRALLTYLVAVKAKDDKKGPIASVKQILATDDRISKIRSCTIECDEECIYLGGWKCNTKSGEIEIGLANEFHSVHFTGSVTRMPNREYVVEITGVAHGKRRP
jgi:hypothetical protein